MQLFAKMTIALSVLLVACVVLAQEPAAKTIKQVMVAAHKPPANLLRKVAQGQAGDAEKKELLNLYKTLAANKPPRGEQADWTERTGLLVAAAEAAVKGDPEAGNRLTKVSDCMACHSLHK